MNALTVVKKIATMISMAGLCCEAPLAYAQTTAPVRPGPVTVTPAVVPTIAEPIRTKVATSNTQIAPLVAPTFDDAAFRRATETSSIVVLLFASATDAVWAAQAAAFKAILQEAEFNQTLTYQVDVTNAELSSRFSVKSAGTILVFKAGVERLRSTKMMNPDVIRKMLRLNSVL